MRRPDEGPANPMLQPHPQSVAALAAAPTPVHVVMIAHGFPPANNSAALRALTLAEGLDRPGWRTTVVSVRSERHASTDPSLAERVPAACTVRTAFSFDTKSALSLRGRYARLLAFPDRDASWIVPAVRQALRAHRLHPIDAVWSTSPPVTAHCIAALVRRATGTAWVAELRDPWNLGAPPGPLSTRADRRLERAVYARADRIVVTTDGLADQLRQHGGDGSTAKIRVVPNGFDEADFAGLRGAAPPEARFTIVHAGSCRPPYRDPRGFLQALRRCVQRGDLPSDTQVVFLGAGDALRGVLADSLSPAQLQGRVQLIGRVPHRQAIASMLEASVLLLLQDWEPHRTSVPQKAYEYLRSGRLILAIAPPSSDTAALVAKHPGVFLAAPTDLDEMVAQLVAAYRTWCADPHRTFARAVSEYDRRRLASAMLAVIDEVRRDRSRAACP